MVEYTVAEVMFFKSPHEFGTNVHVVCAIDGGPNDRVFTLVIKNNVVGDTPVDLIYRFSKEDECVVASFTEAFLGVSHYDLSIHLKPLLQDFINRMDVIRELIQLRKI